MNLFLRIPFLVFQQTGFNVSKIENELIQRIPTMFGDIDFLFAIHPLNKERAINILNYSFYNHVTKERFIELCKQYLAVKGCTDIHVNEQIEKINQAKFSPYNKRETKSCWLITTEKSVDAINSLDGLLT